MKHTLESLLIVGAVVLATAGAPAAGQVFYSMNDSRWACDRLGTCSNWAIGRCTGKQAGGCAITACAMLLAAKGHASTPATLNRWLTQNSGYDNQCNVIWSKVASVDGSGGLVWVGTGSLSSPADLKRLLDQGHLIIARSARFSSHWVWIRAYRNNGTRWSDFWYWDPWDAQATTRAIGDGWVSQGAFIRIYR